MAEEGVQLVHFVPSMLQAFLQEALGDELPELKQVHCSGEALTGKLRDEFFRRFPGVRLFNLYGPTEASVEVSTFECQPTSVDGSIPIGRPAPNCQLFVVDQDGRPVSAGIEGELCIAGKQLARGYLNQRALTVSAFPEKPGHGMPDRIYRTGDRVKLSAAGELWYLGRLDSQIKLRGFRIELGEIEATLRDIDGIQDAAVLVRQLGEGDDRLIAFFKADGEQAATELSPTNLRRALADLLPLYMVPQHFVSMDEFPLNSSGKLDRRALLHVVDTEGNTNLGSLPAKATAAEAMLTKLWAEAIGIETKQVLLEDNFFDLGGHSLLAMEVLRKIEKIFGERLTLRSMLYQTLAETAEKLPNHSETDLAAAYDATNSLEEEGNWKTGKVMRRVLKMINVDSR